jgi:hypothetical protein
LTEKLTKLGLSEEAALMIGNAVVDPQVVRKSLGEPDDPNLEEIRVPGGVLQAVRCETWSRLVMPDPHNPRVGPSRRHPFAVDPGAGDENSRFRPISEPCTPQGYPAKAAELAMEVESRDHLTWACVQAATYIAAKNNWKESIASQGVMEAVWLVPTSYVHQDGTETVTALTTVEGSSRMTAVHDLLSVRSADVPYGEYQSKLRALFRKLNEAFDRGLDQSQAVQLRCERVPALIIVGFRPHEEDGVTFPTAVKSLVALRHVDPPTPWGDGPESESLADEVLDELYRRDLISKTEKEYYGGACTKAEARSAHLSDDPAERSARIVALFTGGNARIDEALRVAVTSQSTRKRITDSLRIQLATALILRSVVGDPLPADRIRPYMGRAYAKPVHAQDWDSTGKTVDTLVEKSLAEVRAAIGDGSIEDPGAASIELAVRAAYPLLVTGRLSRGTDSVDRRNPGDVLDAMRRTVHGVHQLAQVLRDFQDGQSLRAVTEDGVVRKVPDGSVDQVITEPFLRQQFPPPGTVRSRPSGKTPAELFQSKLADFSEGMEKLQRAYTDLGGVVGEDGIPIADSTGVNPDVCRAWRSALSDIDDELNVWSRTYRRKYGTTPNVVPDIEDDFHDEMNIDEEEECFHDEPAT